MFEGNFASQKAFFAKIFTVRRSSFAFSCLVEKHGRKRKELGKQIRIKISKVTLISKQRFYMSSNFETRNWKSVCLPANFSQFIKFLIEIFTFLRRVRIWTNFFTTRQFFESKILKRISRWSEIIFRKPKLAGKLNFK